MRACEIQRGGLLRKLSCAERLRLAAPTRSPSLLRCRARQAAFPAERSTSLPSGWPAARCHLRRRIALATISCSGSHPALQHRYDFLHCPAPFSRQIGRVHASCHRTIFLPFAPETTADNFCGRCLLITALRHATCFLSGE